jgi:alpha-L-rhamnosidase
MVSRNALLACGALCLSLTTAAGAQVNSSAALSVTNLLTNNLVDPLGTGEQQPRFSWQLVDARAGARQSAYQLLVASSPDLLTAGNADVWDSGRMESGQSIDVAYTGPSLHSTTRYYWRVLAWDASGTPYPASTAQWWETGLLEATDWKAGWIGAETEEHKLVRESGAAWIWTAGHGETTKAQKSFHGFRLDTTLPEAPEHAILYVTAKDSPSAWVNGEQIIDTQPLPAWGNSPWGTYQQRDLSGKLQSGPNMIAIGATVYDAQPAAMSAVLLWQGHDGKYHVLATGGDGWKAIDDPPQGWTATDYADAAWPAAATIAAAGSDGFGRPWPADSVNLLRTTFTLSKPIRSARLYATALGAYEVHLNGQKVGDQILSPGWTDYRERVFSQAYDVTSMLHSGDNALGAMLAPGWYSTPLMWLRQPYNYGNTPPALRAQLRVEFTDGTVQWINTGDSWKAHESPVLQAEIYDGERYDARKEVPGWDMPGGTSAGWKPVEVVYPRPTTILAQSFPPIREAHVFTPVNVTKQDTDETVYDFGQEVAGVARLQVSGPAGTRVRLRFAEVLNPDGTLYTENLRSAKATDEYTLKGSGTETYEPAFTFHGFRYVGVSGLPKGDHATVESVAFYTAAPATIQLTTSDPIIGKLWSNIQWGQRSNFISVPTDCPQRDERLGWAADAQVFWRTASYDMSLPTFTRKYAGDLRGTAIDTGMFGIYAPGTTTESSSYSPGWSDAGIIIPWTGWLQYGDTRVASENWDAMARYLDVIEGANPNHLWRNMSGINFGDWLAPGAKTANVLAATAYWAYDAELMRQMAHALGKTDAEQKYAAMFAAVRNAFQQRYVRADGTVTGGSISLPTGGDVAVEHATAMEADDGKTGEGTQTGYALALYMRLVPDNLRAAAADKLVALIHKNNDLLGTGFLGTPYILAVLADSGHADMAYTLLLNTKYPSWGYQIEHGATTMWERWNGDKMMGDPGMNSFNHYAYGAVAAWIYGFAAGIDASSSDPGYHTVKLHPNFSRRLGSLDVTFDTPYGPVRSAWKAPASGPVTWNITIPANAAGSLEIRPSEIADYTMDGQALARSQSAQPQSAQSQTGSGERVSFVVPAGTHAFRVALPQSASLASK